MRPEGRGIGVASANWPFPNGTALPGGGLMATGRDRATATEHGMEGGLLDFTDVVKGHVTQSLMTALLENSGYKVMPLGVEERLRDIKYLDYDAYARLSLPPQLRTLPDLLATEPDLSAAYLIEVKFRARLDQAAVQGLCTKLAATFEHWPDAIVALFLSQSFCGHRGYIQDHLRVLRRSDMAAFADQTRSVGDRWEQLSMAHRILPRLKADSFLLNADRITETLARLGAL